MATVSVIGFGGRTPLVVLDLLTQLSRCTTTKNGIQSIIPVRSQSLELALLHAPYRLFLQQHQTNNSNKQQPCDDETNKNSVVPLNVLVYCLPASYTEYTMNYQETAQIRSALLDSHGNSLVVLYDPNQDGLVTGANSTTKTIDMVIQAMTTEERSVKQELASTALRALSDFDRVCAEQMIGTSNGQDVVIVVGSGGREHALAVALAQSPLIGQIICCPGNGGTAQEGGKIKNQGTKQDNDTIVALVQEVQARMVVIGPEQPLVDGLVNVLSEQCPGVLAFGPTQEAAQLEASKAFTKDFLQQYNIPTAKYRNFTNVDEALAYIETLDIPNDRQVVKASGLAAGKGVLLPETKEETIQAVKEIMSDKAFGNAGDTCVIESFMTGPEASCLAFCDGKIAKLMPAAQDHKRALDGDTGLNTGGMGAYAPAPCVTPQLQQQIEAMCTLTVQKMAEQGTPYVGVLYAGMMLTPSGPSVLEFNCRFGDPETQVLLPLLETDLYEIMIACCTGTLQNIDVRFKESKMAATVVCAAKGYPETYPKNMIIKGLPTASKLDSVKVYHAGTVIDSVGNVRCTGGRVLAVTGVADTLKSALKAAYSGVNVIDFEDENNVGCSLLHSRTDIGKKAVEKKLRIGVLGSTRGTSLVHVINACTTEEIPAEIVAVVSNLSSAPILEKGRQLGPNVLVKAISAKGLSRDEFDAECTAALLSAGVEYIILVGYMRILSKSFTDFWKGRCINVHPSLLPKHAGGMDLAVHQAVIDAKEDTSGCTIHQVTEEVDGGPIVVQKIVQVDAGDTAESLKAKIQPLEGPAFVEAIQMYCRGDIIRYADAGVSIEAGNLLVDMIKPLCKQTRRNGCDADLGGFGGLFDLAAAGYDSANTVLIGATDGVGTKLRIAHATKKHDTVGIDLVAMCVNDLIVAGGEPLFFLDYFATGHLEVDEAADVVKGIAEGCVQAGCGLIGGETAEMPSMYAPGDYDLAGFAVGAVHRDRILPKGVSAGDVLLGLASSGIHSNGFSLVRKLIQRENLEFSSPCPWDSEPSTTIGDSLLTPTKIYVKACLPLLSEGLLKGMAHITGGGLLENLPRSFPKDLCAEIAYHPPLPPVFKWMKNVSGLDDNEMLKTFNCGIGMVLIVPRENVQRVIELLHLGGEKDVCELGLLVDGDHTVKMKVQLA